MEHWSEYARIVTALMVITSPVSTIPMFITLTHGRSQTEKRQIAGVAALTVACVFVTTVFLGESVLRVVGVNLPSFRVGGRMKGLTRFSGHIVCTACTVEEVRAGQPQLRRLYEFDHKFGPAVMQVDEIQNSTNGSPLRDQALPGGLWRHIHWPPASRVALRAPDRVVQDLFAEENMFKPLTITGMLRTTRVFDIMAVDHAG